MKLNQVEKALMNNPVRAMLQRSYEAPLLERLGGRVEGKRVLEVGCGRGVGTEIIFERFGAQEVYNRSRYGYGRSSTAAALRLPAGSP